MNKIYIIADTHFGNQKAIEFRPFATIQEHDEYLVDAWNSVVNKRDTVWHLGDVYFGGAKNHTILDRLNGIKRLVLGNHDTYPKELYAQYFTKVFGAVELKNCILTHIPVHESQFHRYKMNIHGHLHSNFIDDSRYFCVSSERIGYKPKLLDEILC